MRPLLLVGSLMVLVSGGLGCGRPAPPASVAGTVSLDNAPLPDGAIVFDKDDGRPPFEAPITDGRFTVACPPGTYVVRICAWKTIPLPPGDPSGNPTSRVNILPERFHSRSTLAAEVGATGSRELQFAVSSK